MHDPAAGGQPNTHAAGRRTGRLASVERLEQAGGWLLVKTDPPIEDEDTDLVLAFLNSHVVGEPSGLYFAALPTRFSTSSSRWVRSASTITDGRLLKAIEWSG